MILHPHIVFVGDRPNPARNKHMDVAFVGTLSYKTLLEWIYRLDLDINYVTLTNAYDGKGNPKILPLIAYNRETKVVALGQAAADYLTERGIIHFALPHPSGMNRMLNDKTKISQMLAKARSYIIRELS